MAALTPWRDMPAVVKWLLGAFALTSLPLFFASPETQSWILTNFSVFPARVAHEGYTLGVLATLVTHAFLHANWLHLGMNALIYLQAAPTVAQRLGGARFLLLFFISAIGGALTYLWINPESRIPAVGASGAICGLFAAFFLAWAPNPREALRNPQVRYGVLMFLGINVGLAALARISGTLPIAWEAHLGGFVAGGIAYFLLAPKHRAVGPWG